jgi:hypothetical protein
VETLYMEVYREVEELGRNEEESGCFDKFMSQLLERWWEVGDVDWRV